MNDPNWDEASFHGDAIYIFSLTPSPNFVQSFGQAREADIVVPIHQFGLADVYIDDIIPVGL